ncbi:MAG: DUF1801 domain-containing protein [Hyphomicrobium sp.]|nr:DUF1801 domain-containing protein [Hyphomicrobium sp.]MBN9267796.1 DUF1801 domain-containing protein [Hyphomicrobium sp.]MBN9276110.1 DUF1801 domain-containing protein [Hyphomicrobium sp.]OJU20878.1 MAG: hypothetical protein BGN89_19870 [Alphaproteobacteria bacterium 64-6]
MVQSKTASVDEWLDGLAASDRPLFERLRAVCREELAGWDERMQWGMPGYGPPGRDNAVSFNRQKRHIAFYAGPTAIERFQDRLANLDCGKGCVRYRRADEVDFAVVRAMLRDIHARGGPMC